MALPGVITVTDLFAQCPASTAKTNFTADCNQLLADIDTAVSAAIPPGTGRLTANVAAVLKENFLLWAQNLATAIDTWSMPLTTVTPRFTNPRDVVRAIQAALVAGLPDIFPDDAIIISDPDEWESGTPEPMIAGPFLAIALTDSDFPDDVQVGGGAATCEELAAVTVTIFSNERLDQTGHMPAAVYDIDGGLLELKRRVLRVLVGADPTGDNALPLLSQLIPIQHSSKPRKNAEGIWFLSLTIGTSYFWDLT